MEISLIFVVIATTDGILRASTDNGESLVMASSNVVEGEGVFSIIVEVNGMVPMSGPESNGAANEETRDDTRAGSSSGPVGY